MVRIRLLGAPTLEIDGQPVPAPVGRPAQTLLGWLALHPGIHARSKVAGRLWPDVLDSSARASLRNALSGIRRAIGPAADRVLVATREHVGLTADPEVWVDANTFEALIDAGQHEQALALCGGELLAGLDDEWVLVARDEHRERRAGALAALAAAAESAGKPAEAIRYSRERVALDPLDEPAHRDLIIRLARGGDRAGAMGLYQRLADRLRRELGVAVSPQTRALAERLRAGQLDEVAPATTTVSLRAARGVAPPLPDSLAARRFRTAFVGRARQLAWLHRLWGDVVGGERRLALLAGEPGIGKTRLLAQFAVSVCDLGAAVIYGRADEDALISYQPFVQAIRAAVAWGVAPQDPDALAGIVPDLAHGSRQPSPSTPEAASRLRMFEAACDVFDIAAAERPLVLALDDLHWADEPTLRLLAHLARRPQPAPVLLLCAYRQTELSPGESLAGLLADLRREIEVEEITLDGLASEDVAALLAQSTRRQPADRIAPRIRAQTAGNPFFIEELIRDMDDRGEALAVQPVELPASIRQAIGHRVARLGSEAVALLTAGAVLGPEFDVELAAEVEGLPLDAALRALDRAVHDGLIVEVSGPPGRVTFTHALVRDALAGSLTAARRARLHALAAAALEPRAERDPERHLGALVHHALEGAPMSDQPLRAAELAQQAAARAAAAYDDEESARLLQRAQAILRRVGAEPDRQATVLCSLGEALQRAGEHKRALKVLGEAVEVARGLGDRRLLARATLAMSGGGVTILDVDHAFVARLEDALAALGGGDEALRARLLARLSIELAYDPDESRRQSASLEALELARRSGDPATLAAALSARHVVLSAPQHTTARLESATEMLELARRAGDRELALQARNWRVVDLFELGDGPLVETELDAYAALATQARLPSFSWYVPLWRATLATLAGRMEEGRDLAQRSRDLGRRAGDANAEVFFQANRHMSWLADERYEEWTPQVLAFSEQRTKRSQAGLAYLAGIASVLAATGRLDEARSALDVVAADDFATVPRDMNWISTMASATEVCAHLGDKQRARTLRSLLEPYGDRMVTAARAAFHHGSVAYFLARLAATLGDHRAADELYTDAAQRDERAGAAIWVARDLRRHAELLLAHDDNHRGQQLAQLAAAAAEAAGLTRTFELTTARQNTAHATGELPTAVG